MLLPQLFWGCLALSMLLAAVLWVPFGRRYGYSRAGFGVIIVALASAAVALAVGAVAADYGPFPAASWQRILVLKQAPADLVYRPGVGLILMEDREEVPITDKFPACLPDGTAAQWNKALGANEVELTEEPVLDLPPPPCELAHQALFNIWYPMETDAVGVVGYAFCENREVWCAEAVARGGAGGSVAMGLSGAIVALFSLVAFVGSFAIGIVALALVLEAFERRASKGRGI